MAGLAFHKIHDPFKCFESVEGELHLCYLLHRSVFLLQRKNLINLYYLFVLLKSIIIVVLLRRSIYIYIYIYLYYLFVLLKSMKIVVLLRRSIYIYIYRYIYIGSFY